MPAGLINYAKPIVLPMQFEIALEQVPLARSGHGWQIESPAGKLSTKF
jgi:hypothetical protein